MVFPDFLGLPADSVVPNKISEQYEHAAERIKTGAKTAVAIFCSNFQKGQNDVLLKPTKRKLETVTKWKTQKHNTSSLLSFLVIIMFNM